MSDTPTHETLIASLLASDWEGYVRQIRRIEFGIPRDSTHADLGSRHGQGVDMVERFLAWPEEDARNRAAHFIPVLAHANLNAAEVIQVLRAVLTLKTNAKYRLTDVIRAAFARDIEVAHEVSKAMVADLPLALGAPNWVHAFCQAAPQDAAVFSTQISLTEPDARSLLSLFLETLRSSEPSIKAVLEPHFPRFLEALLQDGPFEELYSSHWAAVVWLGEVHEPAMRALMLAVTAGQASAVVALASSLPGRSSTTLGAGTVLLQDAVALLLEKGLYNERVRGIVDTNVSSLLYNATLRHIIVGCVQQLATQQVEVAHAYSETLQAIAQQTDDFSTILTTWLTQEASQVAVKSLLDMCSGGIAPIVLNASVFQAATQERQVVACRRLLNLTLHGPTLCQFIGILAEDPALQPHGLSYAQQMLRQAMDEYPGSAQDFLKSRTRHNDKDKEFAKLYRPMLTRALRWHRVLKSLPDRLELRPSSEQRQALRAMQLKRARETMRAAEEGSIFASISTKLHVAQGHRFVSHMEHGPSEITSMTSLSHSFELPSSELSDPLGARFRRLMAWKASS